MTTSTQSATTNKVSNVAKINKVSNIAKVVVKANVAYLKEGFTGKQIMKMQCEGNKASKVERKSFSFCLKQVLKHQNKTILAIRGFKESDCTPKNLSKFLTKTERERNNFSDWLVINLIKRYYSAQ
jgi:hypothetical protein